MQPLTGLVLAGGASRRMGTDKALLVVDGERLADRAVRVLSTVCERVVVASGERRLAGLAVEQLADALPGAGPLGGLVAGLEAARTPLVAVLAVDLPDAAPEVFTDLAQRWRGEPALVPVVGGRPQALHAVWAASAAVALRTRLAGGALGVIAACEAVGGQLLDGSWPPGLARNLNRPEDLPAAHSRRG